MYKLMIVDDEAIIRRELSGSFAWEAMGFSLDRCVSSGELALDVIRAEAIDVVLLDISMPGMDGLTALCGIKEISPQTEVIILSAYDDFAYVKKGLKQGAFDYILKIDIIDEIESVFRNLREKLDIREKDRRKEEDSRNSEVLADCLLGVVSRVPLWPEESGSRIACLPEGRLPSFPVKGRISLSGLSLFPLDAASEEGTSTMRALLRKGWSPGISDRYGKAGYHRTMILQAIRSLDFPGGGGAVFYDELIDGGRPENYGDRIINIKRKALFGDDSFSDDLEALYSFVVQDPLVLADQIREISHQLYFGLTELIEEDFRSGLKEDFLYQCQRLFTAGDLSVYVRKTIDRLYRDYLYRQQFRFSGNIHRAEELIRSLYVTNLRLDEVAKAIDMSSSSFKLRFKEQTGKSFIAYLQHVRVSNARDLLANTDLKIYEVADQVGYGDEKYFRKVFKQETGLNPREYRESHKSSS